MSFVEATCAVLLALATAPQAASAQQKGVGYLLDLQRADGGWPIAQVDRESGWMTAWAVWALARLSQTQPPAFARGVAWLLGTRGVTYADQATRDQARRLFAMDAALAGWPWQPGDTSWVFPTALSLLALAAAGMANHPRFQEGVDYLLNRQTPEGGWNIGNPEIIGKTLPPTIQATAVGLMALQAARDRAGSAVVSGQATLDRALATAHAPADLAWGLWGIRQLDGPRSTLQARLDSLQQADGSWEGNPYHTALALLAKGGPL